VASSLEASLATLRETVNKSVEHHETLAFIAVVGDPWTAARKPVVWAF